MSRFKKLVNIIYYLISIISLLIFLLMLNSDNYISQKFLGKVNSEEVLMVLSAFCGMMILVSLFKLLISILQKTNEKYLYLFDEDGEVCISDTAIEKTVKNALREFEEVIEYTVKIKINNKEGKLKVKIKCGLDESICKAKGYYDYLNDSDFEKKIKNDEDKEVVNKESISKEEFAPEILDVIDVISDKSDENVEISNENLHEKSTKEATMFTDPVISRVSIDDFCSFIQKYLHNCLQDFLSERVEKLDIKFYDVKASNRTHSKEKKTSKDYHKKINKKKKRVN